jgi:uncharacterized membrane protein YoaT (DUF817 family)
VLGLYARTTVAYRPLDRHRAVRFLLTFLLPRFLANLQHIKQRIHVAA